MWGNFMESCCSGRCRRGVPMCAVGVRNTTLIVSLSAFLILQTDGLLLTDAG